MFRIKKVAVLGSGVMGSGIACHLANCGFDVLLLDIVPRNLTEDQKNVEKFRNSIVNSSLQSAIKSKPAPLFSKSLVSRIETGNFEDDLSRIKECDWVIEVIIENLKIKQDLFARVESHIKPGTLVSSNTSSIPIHLLCEGRSDAFKEHFLGTHFFNPPRYLELFEVIPTQDTSKKVVDFFLHFGENFLGKLSVLCKDTPGFIGNRIGVYSMAVAFQLASEFDLTIQEVDKLTGPALSRPKTGTFRLTDLVGLDVSATVTQVIKDNCPNDDMVQELQLPSYFQFLIDNKFYGNKSGQGFYKKSSEKDESGKSIILGLDLNTNAYVPPSKSNLKSLDISKQIDNTEKRIPALYDYDDNGGQFIKKLLSYLFSYSSLRIPEISDDIFWVDRAMKAGYAWGFGPFEYWDLIGVKKGKEVAEQYGLKVADWVQEMLDAGFERFYKTEAGKSYYYDVQDKAYKELPGTEDYIILDRFKDQSPVFQNDELTLHDIGDGVLCAEFTSKMNSIGGGILEGLQECIQIAEDGDWKGLVIGNNAPHFSVGANLMLIGMFAFQQEYQQLNMAVKLFQDTTMRCRYSRIPVVAAVQGYTFGGACETQMHCDSTIAAAESYIGLVEAGVGLIPGGAGTKEFAVRASDDFVKDGVKIPQLIERFKTIAMASVSTSALEARELGLLNTKDEIILNKGQNISRAKEKVLELAENYVAPSKRNDVYVLGRSGLAALQLAANELLLGRFASKHDVLIANKVAEVLCGGDLSQPQLVSEDYLLDLEREAFLSLCGEQKTLERIQYMLENNKPLRN